jgi:hypothetical protein
LGYAADFLVQRVASNLTTNGLDLIGSSQMMDRFPRTLPLLLVILAACESEGPSQPGESSSSGGSSASSSSATTGSGPSTSSSSTSSSSTGSGGGSSGQDYNDPDWLDGTVPPRVWTTTPTVPSVTEHLPADDYEPADVADSGFDESEWIGTTDGSTDFLQGPNAERKFRTTCEPGTAKQLDPILGYQVPPPSGHRHQGTGNVGWDQNSTFATLRTAPSSTCAGGPLNGTIYWEPEVLEDQQDGPALGRRQQLVTFYYINGIQSAPQDRTWLRRNFAFIGGVNPHDVNDTARRAEYADAGLEYPGSSDTSAGFQGWQCWDANWNIVNVTRAASRMKSSSGIELSTQARHLQAEDGSDPWGGTCTGTVDQPNHLILMLVAPGCWDGHNLRAPDGRGHVAYPARKSDNSATDLCPDGWVHVPTLTSKVQFDVAGPADYMRLYFSSDRMASPGAPGDPASKDPCRAIGPYFCNGATAHFDWMYGWKSAITDEWQRECLGIPVRGVAPANGPAECNTSQISKFRKLKYGGPSPDPNMSGGCSNIGQCSDATPGSDERYN